MNKSYVIAAVALVLGLSIGGIVGSTQTENAVTPPMQDIMAAMSADLVGKTGDEFDRSFVSGMIAHHEGAIQMAELARTNASHAEIRQMAEAIISAQSAEIVQMNAWYALWFGSAPREFHHSQEIR